VNTRNVLLAGCGAVGKIRKQFLRHTISDPGLSMLRAIKQHIDPQNIFGNGNLMIE
jgi:alkyldihydroxyacetonephosphate synthase